MFRVVDALECRICACASLMSAPASFSQVAWEVLKQRQFTKSMPSLRPAGLRCLIRILLALMGFPFSMPWNNRSFGLEDLTTLCVSTPWPRRVIFIVFNFWMREITFLLTAMVALLALDFGQAQSPRQKRSSIVIEFSPTSSHLRATSSLTRSPVWMATYTIVA